MFSAENENETGGKPKYSSSNKTLLLTCQSSCQRKADVQRLLQDILNHVATKPLRAFGILALFSSVSDFVK